MNYNYHDKNLVLNLYMTALSSQQLFRGATGVPRCFLSLRGVHTSQPISLSSTGCTSCCIKCCQVQSILLGKRLGYLMMIIMKKGGNTAICEFILSSNYFMENLGAVWYPGQSTFLKHHFSPSVLKILF